MQQAGQVYLCIDEPFDVKTALEYGSCPLLQPHLLVFLAPDDVIVATEGLAEGSGVICLRLLQRSVDSGYV